jgi:hypothetical protein
MAVPDTERDHSTGLEKRYVMTRAQLIDAIANIEIRNVATAGPAAHLVVADDVADAILSQIRAAS